MVDVQGPSEALFDEFFQFEFFRKSGFSLDQEVDTARNLEGFMQKSCPFAN